VTTPIFYVNGSPHIGHAYSGLLADGLARYLRLCEKNVLFCTGTDEHGAKVSESALANGFTDTQGYCDKISEEFRALFDALGTQHDVFVRTTEKRHIDMVERFWRRLRGRGWIERGEHAGWYCKSDEAFLTEAQVVKGSDGVMKSAESGHPVEWLEESNYVFKLSRCQDLLLDWMRSRHGKAAGPVWPKIRENEITSFLETSKLRDLSISRPRERVQWAIPVPDDESQSVYVWMDALLNYLTVTDLKLPDLSDSEISWKHANIERVIHVVGKDILRFHSVYWPAFLHAAGFEMPDLVIAHGHWTVNQSKMSKSLGNVVDPRNLIKKYDTDTVRYALLKSGGLFGDLDFSIGMLEKHRRDDLSNTFGNLLSRCLGRTMSPQETWPGSLADTKRDSSDLSKVLEPLAAEVGNHFAMAQFSKGIESIIKALYEANRVFQFGEPWVLQKNIGQLGDKTEIDNLQKRIDTTLYWSLESLRVTSILLQPVIPNAAEAALNAIGIPQNERLFANAHRIGGTSPHAMRFKRPKKGSVILFPRLES